MRLLAKTLGWGLRAIYIFISRIFIFIFAAYLVLYFTTGHSQFRAWLQDTISDAIPGTMVFGHVQWGPNPTDLRVVDARTFGHDTEEVIRVDAIEARIHLRRTARALWDHLQDTTAHPLRIHLHHTQLLNPWVRIDIDDDGIVGIERAFSDLDTPSPPRTGPPSIFELHSRQVHISGAQSRIQNDGMMLLISGVDGQGPFRLRTGDGTSLRFRFPTLEADHLDLALSSFSHLPEPVHITARHLTIDDYIWDGMAFRWRKIHGLLGHPTDGEITVSGRMDTTTSPTSWQADAHLRFHPGAPYLDTLTGQAIDATHAPSDVTISGIGDVKQLLATWTFTAPELLIGDLLLHQVHAQGRILPDRSPWTRDRHALTVDQAIAHAGGGTVWLYDLLYAQAQDPHPDVERDLSFAIRTEDVDLSPLLVTFMGDELPRLPPSRWSLYGTIALQPDEATQGSRADVIIDEATVRWDTPLWPGLGQQWQLKGALQHHQGATQYPLNGQIEPFNTLHLHHLHIENRRDRFRLHGALDLRHNTIALYPQLQLSDLRTLTRPFGIPDLQGRLSLRNARAFGRLDFPSLDADLLWSEAHFDNRHLDEVKGHLQLHNGRLQLNQVQSRGPLARFLLDASAQLLDPDGGLSERLQFALKIRHLERLLLTSLGPWFGKDARLHIIQADLKGDLSRLTGRPDLQGRAKVLIEHVSIGEEKDITIEADLLIAPQGTLQAERFTLRLNQGATWTGHLRLDGLDLRPNAPPARLSGILNIDATQLNGIRDIANAFPLLQGAIRGHLNFGGDLSQPAVIGTLEIDDLAYGRVTLGSAVLSVTTHDGNIELSSLTEQLFDGFSLEEAFISLRTFEPRQVRAKVGLHQRPLAEWVPTLSELGFDIIASALVDLEIDLVRDTTELTILAEPHSVEILVPERGLRWHNESPLVLEGDGGHFHLDRLTLSNANPFSLTTRAQRLELCGDIHGDALHLDLTGALQLGLVPHLHQIFSVTEGHLIIRDDTEARAIRHSPPCLPDDAPTLALRGTIDAPVAIGSVGLDHIQLVPRGLGNEITFDPHSLLLLRQGPHPTYQEAHLHEGSSPLSGDYGDGRFLLKGVMSFESFDPRDGHLEIRGSDLFMQSGADFAMLVTPDLNFRFKNRPDTPPSLHLDGDLRLSEGRFSKSFDTFAQAVGGAIGARSDVYSSNLLDDLPWLGLTELDLNVTAADFEIQSALPLTRTDLPVRLDLSIAGRLDNPRVFRRVDLLPGGTLTYLVFERTFTVNHGAIDFDGDPEHPLVDVTAATQISYLQRIETAYQEEDEKEVSVELRMTGRVPDLKIELSSDDPSFDQADIQSLLITGKPRRDIDRSQESRVVSADLASVLNAALSAPFVRTASVGVDQKGGLEYRVGTCFAPNLCFDTTTVSDNTETTLKAKFSLAIGDSVVCEGSLRRSDGTTTARETYAARCRYRIPLE